MTNDFYNRGNQPQLKKFIPVNCLVCLKHPSIIPSNSTTVLERLENSSLDFLKNASNIH